MGREVGSGISRSIRGAILPSLWFGIFGDEYPGKAFFTRVTFFLGVASPGDVGGAAAGTGVTDGDVSIEVGSGVEEVGRGTSTAKDPNAI